MAKPTDPKELLDGVTLEQLKTLDAVATFESFSAAARRFGKVQSAVSQSMQRLERELGLRLFDRSAKAVRLTRAGHAVATAARRVCAESNALRELAQGLRDGDETSLTLVVDSIVPVPALVSFSREFQALYPRVELTLLTETLSVVTALVREKRAAFGIAGPAADFTGLERSLVGEVRLIPVCAKSHPLAAGQPKGGGLVPLSRLQEHVQIVLSERGAAAREATADQGVVSSRTWRVVDLATKHELLRGGLGWGNMPEHLVRADLAAGTLVALRIKAWSRDEHRLSLSLVRRAGGVSGPVAKAARARLSSLCRRELRGAADAA